MRSALILIAGSLIAPGISLAQAAPASQAPPAAQAPPSHTFDVASVRPAAQIDQATILAGLRAGRRPESFHLDGSRATFTYQSLKELIAYAYKVRTFQVSGPDWMVTDRFDIAARLPDGASRDDVPAMLQALLVDRFKLAAHLETAEHPVLGLMLAKGGSKLQRSTATPVAIDPDAPLKPGETKVDTIDGAMLLTRNPNGSTTYNIGTRGSFTLTVDGQNGTMHMDASGMTLKGFANMLTLLGGGNGRQVVDMTGLTGNYELTVEFSLSDLAANLHDEGIDVPTGPGGGGGASGTASDPGGSSTVSDALAKLGLKLERSKANIQQLIVDHVEKTAAEN
ncbi:MAG: TIGR03435 family protein [Acidobacteriaceae bacterium]|jgi:uncharacterized protein (TIGR03435 family)